MGISYATVGGTLNLKRFTSESVFGDMFLETRWDHRFWGFVLFVLLDHPAVVGVMPKYVNQFISQSIIFAGQSKIVISRKSPYTPNINSFRYILVYVESNISNIMDKCRKRLL